MRLLIVDTLNLFMHKFPANWNMSFSIVKAELTQFANACEASGFKPILILDLYKLCQVGHQKWKRRQRKLYSRNRVVPCSASCLIGMILAETDIAWSYATTMEADDLIIEIASKAESCTVLSGDKGFLRVCNRSFCVARQCSYTDTLILSHVEHADNCNCCMHVDFPRIKLMQNAAKYRFYLNELRTRCVMSKGVFYTAFSILPCMWCHMQSLRQHLYFKAGVQTVHESHVCATLSTISSQLVWDHIDVYACECSGNIRDECIAFMKRFESMSRKAQINSTDFSNAMFACAVTSAQILTEIWFIDNHDSPTLNMMDDVEIGYEFRKNLSMVQKHMS